MKPLAALRAFAWLRFREAVNAFTRTRRRGSLARASGMAEVLLPAVFWLLLVPAAALSAAIGYLAGRALADGDQKFVDIMRIGLAVLGLSIGVGILLRSVQGTTRTSSRFALLPISRGALHRLEVASSFADPWLAVATPGVLTLAAGLTAAGDAVAGAAALAAGLVLLLFLACGCALLSFGSALLLRRRGRREIAALAVFLGAFALPFVPYLLLMPGGAGRLPDHMPVDGLRTPSVFRLLPTELYVRAIGEAAGGRPLVSAAWTAALGALAAFTYAASGRLYGALLDARPSAGGRRRLQRSARLASTRRPRLGLVPPPVAALAIAEVQTVIRTVQGRMAVLLVPLFYAGLALFLGSPRATGLALPAADAGLLAAGGIAFCLLGLQGVLFNQFGIDGTGLTRELLAPVTERALLAGKAIGGGLLYALACGVFLVPTLALKHATAEVAVVSVLGGAAVYLLVAPVAALLSMTFPKASDLAALGREGKPHDAAAVLGMLASVAATMASFLVAMLARVLLRGPVFPSLLVGTWVIFSLGFSMLLFEVAARGLAGRREALSLAATRR